MSFFPWKTHYAKWCLLNLLHDEVAETTRKRKLFYGWFSFFTFAEGKSTPHTTTPSLANFTSKYKRRDVKKWRTQENKKSRDVFCVTRFHRNALIWGRKKVEYLHKIFIARAIKLWNLNQQIFLVAASDNALNCLWIKFADFFPTNDDRVCVLLRIWDDSESF